MPKKWYGIGKTKNFLAGFVMTINLDVGNVLVLSSCIGQTDGRVEKMSQSFAQVIFKDDESHWATVKTKLCY